MLILKSVDFDHTWLLFQKYILDTKLDIDVFIFIWLLILHLLEFYKPHFFSICLLLWTCYFIFHENEIFLGFYIPFQVKALLKLLFYVSMVDRWQRSFFLFNKSFWPFHILQLNFQWIHWLKLVYRNHLSLIIPSLFRCKVNCLMVFWENYVPQGTS